MDLNYYVQYVKDNLTGYGLLELELDDAAVARIVEGALCEVQRYYDQPALITVPVSGTCIDLVEIETSNNIKISSIAKIYRAEAINGNMMSGSSSSQVLDPTWIGFWQNNGTYNMTGYTNAVINYVTLQRTRNTISTDLTFKEDPIGRKLYVNYSMGVPTSLTLEYIPKLEHTNQVVGEYWIDILKRMSVAYAKVAIGRIRTRFKQSTGGLWTDDGDAMLSEGNQELTALRERLVANSDFIQPID